MWSFSPPPPLAPLEGLCLLPDEGQPLLPRLGDLQRRPAPRYPLADFVNWERFKDVLRDGMFIQKFHVIYIVTVLGT